MAPVICNWLYATVFSFLHPFFISMVDINYDAPAKSIQVSVRIYTDDFEKNLRKQCNCKVELMKPTDKNAMNALVSNYVQKHLQIVVDGKPVTMQYAGYEQEDASTWSFYEAGNISSFKKVDITTDIMYDFTEQQINMIHVKSGSNEKSDKIDYPDKKISFSF